MLTALAGHRPVLETIVQTFRVRAPVRFRIAVPWTGHEWHGGELGRMQFFPLPERGIIGGAD